MQLLMEESQFYVYLTRLLFFLNVPLPSAIIFQISLIMLDLATYHVRNIE